MKLWEPRRPLKKAGEEREEKVRVRNSHAKGKEDGMTTGARTYLIITSNTVA